MPIQIIKDIFSFAFTRYERVQNYIKTLEEKYSSIAEKDKEAVKEINFFMEDRIKRLKKLYVVEMILYLFVYFSVISFVMSDFYVFEGIRILVKTVISVFGSAIFLIGLFLVTRLKELYYQDLVLLSSHIISIYSKYDFDDEFLFGDYNSYSEFLKFFKKRGF